MSGIHAAFLWLIANVLIFSTVQAENWTWGIQMIVYMPIMFITTGFLVIHSGLGLTSKSILCILLAIASTFSYANGQLAWPVLFVALVIAPREDSGLRIRWRFWLMVIAFIVNLLVYYDGYRHPPRHPSMLLILTSPFQAAQYFLAFLGASLADGFGQVSISAWFGSALLICFAFAIFYIWRRREQPGFAESTTDWLLICAYALVSAAITTAGRLGFGVEQSLESRYTTFSLYLVLALLYLGAIIVKDLYGRGKFASARWLIVLGLSLILLPQANAQITGTQRMWLYRRSHLIEKACVQLLNISVVPPWLAYPEPQYVVEEANALDALGDLNPGLVKDRDLSRIEHHGTDDQPLGYFDSFALLGDDSYRAMGWAIDPTLLEPAGVIILAAEDTAGIPRGFALAIVTEQRDDVAQIKQNSAYELTGWDGSFKISQIPAGTRAISAWEYDPLTGYAYRLAGSFPWKPPVKP
jgi:hypothetical protein